MPGHQQACMVCESLYSVPPSWAKHQTRCPDCVQARRTRCAHCNQIMVREPSKGHGGHRTFCPACSDVTVQCRGYIPFGNTPAYANDCGHTYTRSVTELERCTTYDPAKGTFICRHCNGAERFVRAELKRLRETGIKERVRTWEQYKQLLRIRAGEKPGFVQQQGRKGVRPGAMIAARRAGKGGAKGADAARVQMAARWRRGVTIQAGLCRWCDKLVLLFQTGPDEVYELHGACYQAAQRTPEGRLWLSRRRKALLQGLTKTECDERFGAQIPTPTKLGRRPTSEDLTRNFGWAVRHLLGEETRTSLAKEAVTTRQVVSYGIKAIVTLLPDPQLATGRFRTYVESLREAAHISPGALDVPDVSA